MTENEALVRQFFDLVRSGKAPERAADLMASRVRAHQIVSEALGTVVERTPGDYAAHVVEMVRDFGPFTLTIDELLCARDRVYVRWTQSGHHVGTIEGRAPTGRPLVQIASAVYRISGGKIAEYWIQIDRLGLTLQL